MNVHTIATTTHGRYLVSTPPHPGTVAPPHPGTVAPSHPGTVAPPHPGTVAPPHPSSALPLLVGFHGYKETATTHMSQLKAIAGSRPWLLVSVQGLSRFYTRGDHIAASWMTREDREQAIADNIAYVAAVVADVQREYPTRRPLVYAGFSQGVAMAYRAAALAGHSSDGLIVLAGDVPPDVAPLAGLLPSVLIGRGTADHWYTEDKAARDLAVLRGAGVPVVDHVFEGGHVWGESFLERAGQFLDARNHP